MDDMIWQLLGIEPTADARSIKKAYAAKVKTCHQEDDAEGWQRLHKAYETALSFAKRAPRQDEKPALSSVRYLEQPEPDERDDAGESSPAKEHGEAAPEYDFSQVLPDSLLSGIIYLPSYSGGTFYKKIFD